MTKLGDEGALGTGMRGTAREVEGAGGKAPVSVCCEGEADSG